MYAYLYKKRTNYFSKRLYDFTFLPETYELHLLHSGLQHFLVLSVLAILMGVVLLLYFLMTNGAYLPFYIFGKLSVQIFGI